MKREKVINFVMDSPCQFHVQYCANVLVACTKRVSTAVEVLLIVSMDDTGSHYST